MRWDSCRLGQVLDPVTNVSIKVKAQTIQENMKRNWKEHEEKQAKGGMKVQSIYDIPQASYLTTGSSHQKGSDNQFQAYRQNPVENLIIDFLTWEL